MDPDRAYERAELLKAFSHSTRLQILAELSKGTRCVTDMEDILPVTQVNISQHLTVLRNAKLVDFAQDGAVRCYYLSRPKLVEGVLTLLSADHPVLRKTRSRSTGKRPGREGEGGGSWLKTPAYLFWNTSLRKRPSLRRQICWRRPGSGRGCPRLPFRPDAFWTSTGKLPNTLLTRERPPRIPPGPVSIRASSVGGMGAPNMV